MQLYFAGVSSENRLSRNAKKAPPPSKRMLDSQWKTAGGTPATYLTAEVILEKFRAAEAEKAADKSSKAAAKVQNVIDREAVEAEKLAAREVRICKQHD